MKANSPTPISGRARHHRQNITGNPAHLLNCTSANHGRVSMADVRRELRTERRTSRVVTPPSAVPPRPRTLPGVRQIPCPLGFGPAGEHIPLAVCDKDLDVAARDVSSCRGWRTRCGRASSERSLPTSVAYGSTAEASWSSTPRARATRKTLSRLAPAPPSIRMTVCLETPARSATCAAVNRRRRRHMARSAPMRRMPWETAMGGPGVDTLILKSGSCYSTNLRVAYLRL